MAEGHVLLDAHVTDAQVPHAARPHALSDDFDDGMSDAGHPRVMTAGHVAITQAR
jgi:hypothetical protein